jgi:hypothetical protein
VLGVEAQIAGAAAAAAAAASAQQQDVPASCLPNGLHAGSQGLHGQQQPEQQQVELPGNGKAANLGSICSSDTALADRQQQ